MKEGRKTREKVGRKVGRSGGISFAWHPRDKLGVSVEQSPTRGPPWNADGESYKPDQGWPPRVWQSLEGD